MASFLQKNKFKTTDKGLFSVNCRELYDSIFKLDLNSVKSILSKYKDNEIKDACDKVIYIYIYMYIYYGYS